MVRKHKLASTKKAGRRRTLRGGGYSFGGSILDNAGGANAGAAIWNKNMGSDCGADLQGRGGNNSLAGGRRRKGKKTRRTRGRGRKHVGGSGLALMSPRTGYTFDGTGYGGISNTPAYGAGPLYKI